MPKGEATITYEDDQAASSAIDWFNSKQTIYLQYFFTLVSIIFTARGYAKRGICRRRVSVCVSVCLSHSGIV